MIDEIKREIERIERDNEVKVLLAVESGSRAWGFASTDSDWDVRFIYLHRPEWYLKIDNEKDSFEEILDNDLDLSGWELRKALRLFRKSNPPMLEWLHGPIVYREHSSLAPRLRELSKTSFSPRALVHHYVSMARNNMREFGVDAPVRLKKYFYVLRPMLACSWVLRTQTIPPVLFTELLDAELNDTSIRALIDDLLVRKMAGVEMKAEPRIAAIDDFVNERIEFFTSIAGEQPESPVSLTLTLDEIFRTLLSEVWSEA